MAKAERLKITWKRLEPGAAAPGSDLGGGVVLATTSRVDLYQGHRAGVGTGLALGWPLDRHPIFTTAGVLGYRALIFDHAFDHRGELWLHVFSIGDFLRIEPGDVVARLVLVPVAPVDLVQEGL